MRSLEAKHAAWWAVHPRPTGVAALSSPRLLAAVCLAIFALAGGCRDQTAVDVFVDGFEPRDVRFEVEELGQITHDQLRDLAGRGDIDGSLLLQDGSCTGPCRAVIVTIYLHNHGGPEAPPVVRLKSPAGKAARQPIAFRGDQISSGRIGRIRWIVELWPEERRLTATLSASVRLVEPPAGSGLTTEAPPTPTAPAP